MDNNGSETWTTIPQTRMKTQQFLYALPANDPWCKMTGKSYKSRDPAALQFKTIEQPPQTESPGHLQVMPSDRFPKSILYGELADGKCPVSRPKLRLKDDDYDIDQLHWPAVAEGRVFWRTCLNIGVASFHSNVKHIIAKVTILFAQTFSMKRI